MELKLHLYSITWNFVEDKAWNLEPGTWNLDFGTWNLRNLKTWSLDLALMLKPSNCD